MATARGAPLLRIQPWLLLGTFVMETIMAFARHLSQTVEETDRPQRPGRNHKG